MHCLHINSAGGRERTQRVRQHRKHRFYHWHLTWSWIRQGIPKHRVNSKLWVTFKDDPRNKNITNSISEILIHNLHLHSEYVNILRKQNFYAVPGIEPWSSHMTFHLFVWDWQYEVLSEGSGIYLKRTEYAPDLISSMQQILIPHPSPPALQGVALGAPSTPHQWTLSGPHCSITGSGVRSPWALFESPSPKSYPKLNLHNKKWFVCYF